MCTFHSIKSFGHSTLFRADGFSIILLEVMNAMATELISTFSWYVLTKLLGKEACGKL